MERIQNYINAKWEIGDTTRYLDIINPSTGQKIGEVPASTKETTNRAVEVAKIAYGEWREVSCAKRSKYLFKLLELMNSNQD